jgi:hypothetical protein
MKESLCNTDAVRSFKHYGYGAHKISDIGGRTAGAKPCDIIARSPKGRYIAVEGKMMKQWASFSSKVLRPNQRDELDGAANTQEGRGFVFLYVRINAVPGKSKREHWLVVFDWKEYKGTLDLGLRINEMRDRIHGLWLPPLKDKRGKTIYDIRQIMRRY